MQPFAALSWGFPGQAWRRWRRDFFALAAVAELRSQERERVRGCAAVTLEISRDLQVAQWDPTALPAGLDSQNFHGP